MSAAARSPLARHWALDPAVSYLNHGSFGATPRPVLAAQQALRDELEREPFDFLVRRLPGRLAAAREALGAFLGADADGLAFVPNATAGVNAVLRSLDLAPGDELLTTSHVYPACRRAMEYVAGGDLSFYAFEGLKPRHNLDLHITSRHFDEPRCLELIASAERIITVHGEAGDEDAVYLGGLDTATRAEIRRVLCARRFHVLPQDDPGLQGREPLNICNRGRSGAGVQLEIAHGLRRTLFASLDSAGRGRPTDRFGDFVAALREALT